MATTSFPKNKIKVLLLENVHDTAVQCFEAEQFQVERVKTALAEKDLIAKLAAGVHVLGIRSKTQITDAALAQAKSLLSLGCFCIGTNQVDLRSANRRGVPVFNAPFSNTRSVAELIIGEIIALARQLGDRSAEVHRGAWKKVATGCFEVRGKTLGIVGYGHIGSQVGVLAEALGMRVIYFDIATKLPLGNVQPRGSLTALLAESDFVTLHVPETPQTKNMIGAHELKLMKKHAYLMNASRGTVVDVTALAAALKEGHLAGAAVDVYPEEPEGQVESFKSPLQNLPNVILTPHTGGSTEEAQANIGREVSASLTKFINNGSSTGSVNFPQVEAAASAGTHRILNVHRNVPGVLKDINRIVSDLNANIHSQTLSTDPDIGYLVMDLDQDVSDQVKGAIEGLKTSIKTRILY
jgi:D-3-phosphoglycerate dehydrogenase